MEFKMSIEFDEQNSEYYLKFLDIDDRAKKSRFLKRLHQANISVVTMTIEENENAPTPSQRGMYKAFLILLADYTGYSQDEIKQDIYRELTLSKEAIENFSKAEYSAFIERMFLFCSENIGIVVEMVGNKLLIKHQDD